MAASFSLTGSLRLDPRWTDDLNTTTVLDSARVNISFTLADGDGDGEANAFWKDVRTVAPSTTDTIDLSALPINLFGGSDPLDLATVRLIYVRNLSATTTLEYVLSDNNFSIAPQGVFLWANSLAATNAPVIFGSSAEIHINNPGASAADYEIILIGVKAT